jgi:hypothetical protein
MKVLISAYSCEPGKGSERGVGWNVVREVSKYHEVWVLTRPDESKEAIEAELARNPFPNLHFVYFTLPFWQDSLRWGQSGAMQLQLKGHPRKARQLEMTERYRAGCSSVSRLGSKEPIFDLMA